MKNIKFCIKQDWEMNESIQINCNTHELNQFTFMNINKEV